MRMKNNKFLKSLFLLPLMAAIGLTMACSNGDGNEFYTGKVVRVGTEQVCRGFRNTKIIAEFTVIKQCY
jgi:hypothetical protein